MHCLSSFHSAKEKCLPSSDEERKKDILHLLINQFFPMRLNEVTSENGVLFWNTTNQSKDKKIVKLCKVPDIFIS